MESIDSKLAEDLLDDVLTAPPRAHNATPTNDDEVCDYPVHNVPSGTCGLFKLQLLGVKIEDQAMEGLLLYQFKFYFTFLIVLT